MEQKAYTQRAADIEIAKLAARVEELDSDVQKLRGDFDNHIQVEDEKYRVMQSTLNTIQTKVDQLLVEIKEPLESYKTAKAGMTFLKFITETAKWLGPVLVGLMIAYGPTKDKAQEPAQQTQIERTK